MKRSFLREEVMHQQIRHHLEDYLRGGHRGDSRLPEEFQAHLGECAACARELELVAEQARVLQSFRSDESAEPRAGFYARVVERIEQRMEAQRASFWAPFLDRKFGFRLAVASAALVALLGTYLVTSEPAGPEFASAPAVVFTGDSGTTQASAGQTQAAALQQERQRDAVLVNLASYHQ
jgi:predicted anti-sigma-YlaC factor YlaD